MNSFEQILSRLKGKMPSGISTNEGTFAGDILHAVADELARIYSQEMDSITQRAFVASAGGTWLDAVCRDYGIVRLDDESDDRLRERTQKRIEGGGSSGNAADYAAWAMQIEGVTAARAYELARGAGTVDLYIAMDGTDSMTILNKVAQLVEQNRPLCADVEVRFAVRDQLEIEASLVLSEGATSAGVQAELHSKLSEDFATRALSKGGETISLARITGIVLGCSGVEDVTEVTINGTASSYNLPTGHYANLSGIVLETVV